MPHRYPQIWFLRHGQTEWNRAFRLQGQRDSPLTPQGIAEARQQARIMPAILARKPEIRVSPLGRARQTAQIVLEGAAYKTDARLMEIDAGRWQGRTRTEILGAQPAWAAQNPSALEIYARAEGGEGLEAFEARILAFLADLNAPTVVIAHGLLGQVMRAHLRGLDRAQAGGLTNLQGVVYHIENGKEHVLGASE